MVRPSGFEPPTFCSGGKESMPKGKQSYVPGLGKKSVARHSGEVRKPVSIALSTQFSTRLAPGLQFTLAVNERLTFWCRLRNVFEEVFEKGFRRCRLRASRNIGENFMPGQPSGANENASETQGDPTGGCSPERDFLYGERAE